VPSEQSLHLAFPEQLNLMTRSSFEMVLVGVDQALISD
jgi:hypothetical protein